MAREMKDSGIEWFDDIPTEWKSTKVKNLFFIGRGRVIATTELTDKGYPVFSSQTKNDGILGYIDTYDFEQSQLTWTTDGANAGTVFLREGKHNCTNVCGTLLPKNNTNNDLKFLYYILSYTAFFHKRADINGYKIMNNEMADIQILLPPLPEQQKIAAHLDSECAKIDDVITKTKATIEEYKKLKQSVITEAVTKGIRPNREMKDSGVEWIGEIPREWQIQKLKYCCNTRNTKYDESYGNIPYFALENIVSWNGQFINTDSKYDVSQSIICKKGDIVFGKLRPYLAKVYCVKENSCCSSEFAVFHNFSGITRFFYHILLSYWFINIVDASTYGTKMPRANVDFVNNMIIPVPQEVEQQEIADYLDKKCSEIDTLIAKKEQIITELESYKKSLIYEYVTGKKEVI